MKVLSKPKLVGKEMTLDVEVNGSHTYQLGNGVVTHNTSSCILGSSSGIHPHHAKRYFRRVQANNLEAPAIHFQKSNPIAVESSVWREGDYVITFLCEIPNGAKSKNQLSAIEMLENVKLTQNNWVKYGTVSKNCVQPWLVHNVSNTITVMEHEWDGVTDFIYRNRKSFSGISLLPQSGDKDFPQAPFCSVPHITDVVKDYGECALYVSGLIVRAEEEFKNLWKACDFLLGVNGIPDKTEEMYKFKESCEKFANRYLDGDIKKLTYLMKDVHNIKRWNDLSREYKEVDYEEMIEEEDNINHSVETACAGGSCTLTLDI